MQLRGKTVIIPGASRPIGRAIARKFALEGANLVLPCFDWPESTQAMQKEFSGLDIPYLALPADLRDPDQVKALMAAVLDTYGGLHILVNNIERGGMPVVHGSYDLAHNKDQWELEMATCMKAKWLLFRHCLPLLKKSDRGSVVNITSIAGLVGRSGPAAQIFNDGYSAANRAISSLTETWAREGAPEIRVNELMLGLIRGRHGEETRGWAVMTQEQRDQLLGHSLLGRTGTAEEVAEAVFFLAHQAGYMTGAVLRLDGGYVLGGDGALPMPPGILDQE
ncbi:MAG: SDR family oxidoreductase [Desulfocapsaceae bacterium]|nr:SDR family oxidoreductase [Desulfocapsaceae bacterium]